ncbi:MULTISPECIES: hypothetical protein [unclassified Bradyrhizobium]|uniref:hypothetical protein n=1 Tax=unclassified Bradyrhizobium TaxID=2631580 RepID=UPI001FF901C9|nr:MULTISPECIES: hypothetical protein [unclassified Bradyrhizobium]MCK1538686.1 hypothetical protein [Bradyrhizobium sp. 176]MCK1558628.1 hypothetical protein [Bradyrhizobium sp. 171]
MSTRYIKYYDSNHHVAYGREIVAETDVINHLFVWTVDEPPEAPDNHRPHYDDLDELLRDWNKAARGFVFERSIFFCQSFGDPHTIGTRLLDFARDIRPFDSCWGQLQYWREPKFTGKYDTDAKFPEYLHHDIHVPIKIGDVRLTLGPSTGVSPTSLDHFNITTVSLPQFSPDKALSLELKLEHISWSVDGAGHSRKLAVWLDHGGEFTAGAIGLPVTAQNEFDDSRPLHRVKTAFVAKPGVPDGGPQQCRIWSSRIVSGVKPGASSASYYALLDPRDSEDAPDWMGTRRELNSRLLFGGSEIQSTLFSPKGSPFLLNASADAAARFGFLNDLMDNDDGTMSSSGKVIFHPEGNFKITSPAEEARDDKGLPLNVHNRDLIVGAAATEFIDPGSATHVRFDSRQLAFFVENDAKRIFDQTKPTVFTSYVQVSNGGDAADADLHSQATEAPLFEIPQREGSPDHLRRRRSKFGTTKESLPVFAYAGYETGDDSDAGIEVFETTHLSRYRRAKARGTEKLSALLDRAKLNLGVTPQGILAEITDTGLYSRLFFGNPEGTNSNADFCLTIVGSSADEAYNDVQDALAASQLFMIFDNNTPRGLEVIYPSAHLSVAGFSFDVLANTPLLNTRKMAASAFIIKYFKDKSLNELVNDMTLWACRTHLASAATSQSIQDLTGLTGPDKDKDYLKPLKAVWFDTNWQGIVILDLPLPLESMPTTLQALGPGLVQKQGVLPNLRAPYFGMNALAATKAALESSDPPKRPGSVFGAIHYTSADIPNEADWPQLSDHEPGAPSKDPTVRVYRLLVQDLDIGLTNSQISSFSAHVLIGFSHLFWDEVTNPPAKLVLLGKFERRGSEDIFSLVCETPLTTPFKGGSFLKQLTITRAQLSVVAADKDQHTLTAFVGIDGTLELAPLDLPLFTVRTIRLSSFGFTYRFDTAHFKFFNFGFKADGMSADIDFKSGPLLSFLPVKLKGMSIALGDLLDLKDLHFSPLVFPGIDGTTFQFGFLMEFDFGSLGQLAGDLRGLRVPLLLGWRGGQSKPGLAFGIQFPTFDGHLDIGIQQFIRLQAKTLKVAPCYDDRKELTTVGIQAVDAKVVMLGHAWPPEAQANFAIFIPLSSEHKPSWAFGVKDRAQGADWYIGGGYRINLPDPALTGMREIVASFTGDTSLNGDLCDLAKTKHAMASREEWSVVASYKNDAILDVAIAISDPRIYGIELAIEPFGQLDVLYRRVNGQLGIFSLEYCLPGPLRTMQFGIVSVRLPVFRLEIHTDGGFLADFGFPWNNDYARSCQVEFAIFLGSGGFYFGKTSASATELLQFPGGYGYSSADDELINFPRTLRLGFAARVGIGRSFTIGILSAEASLTIFGGLEGAAAYSSDAELFSPTLYALRGYMGLMVDISATVDFGIIRASARILAFVDVGLEIRQVLARKDGTLRRIQPPVVIFADISLTVTVSIEIDIGCVNITIQLSFSTNWHYQETLGSLRDMGAYTDAIAARATFDSSPPPFAWNDKYRYWQDKRKLIVYATVLPCMANPADIGESDTKPCAVGVMLLPVTPAEYALGDFAKFLLGWLLLYDVDATQYETYQLTLRRVLDFETQVRDPKFWKDFQAALLTVVKNQFYAQLTRLQENQNETFVTIPPWPDSTFAYLGAHLRETGVVSVVTRNGAAALATDSAFADYCRHLIGTTLTEIHQLIAESGTSPPDDLDKSMQWSTIWGHMFDTLPSSAGTRG